MVVMSPDCHRYPAMTDVYGEISIGEIEFQRPPSIETNEVVGRLRCDGDDWQRFVIAKRQVFEVATQTCSWGVICYVPYTWSLTLRIVEDVLSSHVGVEHWIEVGFPAKMSHGE